MKVKPSTNKKQILTWKHFLNTTAPAVGSDYHFFEFFLSPFVILSTAYSVILNMKKVQIKKRYLVLFDDLFETKLA